jgi:hypothetical protein
VGGWWTNNSRHSGENGQSMTNEARSAERVLSFGMTSSGRERRGGRVSDHARRAASARIARIAHDRMADRASKRQRGQFISTRSSLRRSRFLGPTRHQMPVRDNLRADNWFADRCPCPPGDVPHAVRRTLSRVTKKSTWTSQVVGLIFVWHGLRHRRRWRRSAVQRRAAQRHARLLETPGNSTEG